MSTETSLVTTQIPELKHVPQLRGRRVFLYFLAFFGTVMAVDAAMVMLAVRTHTGTVTDHPYERGLAYNNVVRAEQSQEKLGWKGSITLSGNRLRFDLRDATGVVIAPDSIQAHISRPAQAGMDFDIDLKSGEAQVEFPAPGLWEVRVFARAAGTSYQQTQRLVVK